MSRSAYVGLTALVCAAATIWLLPSASLGRESELDRIDRALKGSTERLGAAVTDAIAPVSDGLKSTSAKAKAALAETKRKTKKAGDRASRATATDPAKQPPLHGTDPHGQGSVAVVDVNPSSERPLSGASDGGKASGEDAIVGRPRGEKVNGAYHGHITILALLGSELAGVDSAPGETKNGPLQPIQAGILDPLCTSSGGATCLSVLTANSTTTANGSANDFAIARAAVLGLGVGAAESTGTIGEDANCQTSVGTARTANITSSGGAIAQVANSSSTSKSCRGAAPQVTNTSSVIGLGGVQVPIPAAGCADGTPDTVVGLPPLLPIVCNADEIAGAAAVREALDVFVLQVGGSSLAKETTAASESLSVAPAAAETTGPQCSDGVDNDGDGVIDIADPGCHTDGNANNPASFDPNDNSEADGGSGTAGSGDGDGGTDESDNGGDGDGSGGDTQCSDGADNDGDGVIDSRDPGCHSDGDPNNSASYDPSDDSEADGGGSSAAGLPVTGSNIIGLGLAGLLLLAGGLLLRRQEGARAAA